MAFKPLSWLAGQTDFHADAPTTGPGQAAIRRQMQAASGRGQAQAYSMAASARGGSSPLALREAQRQAAMANQSAMQQGAIASGQLEQQRLQNIMQAQQINAETARSNAGGILKLAGVAAGAGALAMSDERTKMAASTTGSAAGAQAGLDPMSVRYAAGGTGMDAMAEEQRKRDRLQAGMTGLSQYMMGDQPSDERTKNITGVLPMPERHEQPKQEGGGLLGGILSDAKAKDLEQENRTLRSRLGAGASAAAGLTMGPMASLATMKPLQDFARGSMGSHTPAAPTPRPALQSQDTPALAPTEAQALAIVRAREEAKQKALERDVANSTEAQAAAANERQAIQAMPGSDSRTAQLGRQLSDDRAKMYPSDEDAKMQFPAGVKPVTFRYKPEAQEEFGLDNDVNVGLLAQDLEKSPEGATVVEEDPSSGMKIVDTPKLTLLATAKLSEMEKRLKKLEGARGKRS